MIAARAIPTQPGLLAKAWRFIKCAWLRWELKATEGYIQECRRSGILDTRSVREFDKQAEALRVQLAMAERS